MTNINEKPTLVDKVMEMMVDNGPQVESGFYLRQLGDLAAEVTIIEEIGEGEQAQGMEQ